MPQHQQQLPPKAPSLQPPPRPQQIRAVTPPANFKGKIQEGGNEALDWFFKAVDYWNANKLQEALSCYNKSLAAGLDEDIRGAKRKELEKLRLASMNPQQR